MFSSSMSLVPTIEPTPTTMESGGLREAIGRGVATSLVGQTIYSQQNIKISKLVEKYLGVGDPKVFIARRRA